MAGRVQVAFLRGINVGGHRKVSMPELRARLEADGFSDVRTYLQSGNVLLCSTLAPPATGDRIREVLGVLGVEAPVVMRTPAELAAIVDRAPLSEVATDDAKLLVVFLSDELAPERAAALEELDLRPDRLLVDGREVYAWCPDGVSSPRIARALSPNRLGTGMVTTGRNWKTVHALAAMTAG